MDKDKTFDWIMGMLVGLAILAYGCGVPNLGHFIMFLMVYAKLDRVEGKIKELDNE